MPLPYINRRASEFDAVVLCLFWTVCRASCSRAIFSTPRSHRAKRLLVIVGSQDVVAYMVK